jgi:hypothetical protein
MNQGFNPAGIALQRSLRGEWVVSATPTLARRLESSVDPCQQGPWALPLVEDTDEAGDGIDLDGLTGSHPFDEAAYADDRR